MRLRTLGAGLGRAASVPFAVVLVAYRALDALLGPLVRPALAYLGSLQLFARLGAAITALPPYALLALLVVPFVIIEPLKAAALYWMAIGHPVQGGVALLVCHALSLVTTERLFHIGKPKLLTIRWFAKAYGFVAALSDRARAWLRTTAVWRASLVAADAVVRFVRRLQSA